MSTPEKKVPVVKQTPPSSDETVAPPEPTATEPQPAPVPAPAPESPTPAPVPAVAPTPSVAKPKVKKPKVKKPKVAVSKKDTGKFKQYRYRTRILKGAILPILYGVVSFQMLNLYVYEFPEYYKYNIMIILLGFLLGLISISSLTFFNMLRAKKNRGNGVKLNSVIGVAIYIPFLLILLTLALFYGLALAWQFSMGFFITAIFPILIVIFYELSSKLKFFVEEIPDQPSEGRRLVAVQ